MSAMSVLNMLAAAPVRDELDSRETHRRILGRCVQY
jgi:hypothetical protein